VASYDFSVVAWEVQTTMHFAEKYSAYDPFDVRNRQELWIGFLA